MVRAGMHKMSPLLLLRLPRSSICNSTLFAYGQTGSGKTFTLEGNDDSPGILPLIGKELFSKISGNQEEYDTKVSVSVIFRHDLSQLNITH